MIAQYEQAVLEWFAVSYPQITKMLYGDIEEFLATESTLNYPALLYKREDSNQVLEKALKVEGSSEGNPTLPQSTFFSFPQVYIASLYVNDEADLFRVANILRQKWARESYVTLRYPSASEQLRVAMRLYYFKLVTDRTGVDTKGPQRHIEMSWRSDLFYEAIEEVKRFTGFTVTLSTGTPKETFEVVNTCCKDGTCPVK